MERLRNQIQTEKNPIIVNGLIDQLNQLLADAEGKQPVRQSLSIAKLDMLWK